MNTVKKSFLISGLVAALVVSGTSAYAWGSNAKKEVNKEQRHSQMQQNQQRADRHAMPRGGHAMRGAVNLDYIAEQLSLTEAQVAAVEQVFSDFATAQQAQMATQREAMRAAETRPTREEMQAMMEAHRAATTVQLTDQLNLVLPVEVTDQLMSYVIAHSGMQHKRGK